MTPSGCFFVQFDGTHIVSGSLDTYIRVWDAETGHCVHTLSGRLPVVLHVPLTNTSILHTQSRNVRTYYIDQDTCMRICGPELLESVLWAVTYVDVITAPIIAPQGIGHLLVEWN